MSHTITSPLDNGLGLYTSYDTRKKKKAFSNEEMKSCKILQLFFFLFKPFNFQFQVNFCCLFKYMKSRGKQKSWWNLEKKKTSKRTGKKIQTSVYEFFVGFLFSFFFFFFMNSLLLPHVRTLNRHISIRWRKYQVGEVGEGGVERGEGSKAQSKCFATGINDQTSKRILTEFREKKKNLKEKRKNKKVRRKKKSCRIQFQLRKIERLKKKE